MLPKKTIKQTSNASARVVDGKLILSLPDAETPVVWQMDLAQSKASALEVRKDEEGKLFTLTLKTPRGETLDIAPFNTKEFAVEGLMAASSALENAHGQIRGTTQTVDGAANDSPHTPITQGRPHGHKSSRKKIVGGIFAVFIVLALFMLWGAQMPRTPASAYPDYNGTAPQSRGGTQSPAGSSASERTGEAVSADDFLNSF